MVSPARYRSDAAASAPTVTVAVAEDAGGRVSVQLTGELDLASASHVATCLDTLTEAGDVISLDLAGVTFIDLSGLRMLLEARRDALIRGKRLHVAVAGDACLRLIELTRTAYLLDPV